MTAEAVAPPPSPTADTDDVVLRRRPDAEPRLVVRPAWTPEAGDQQSAARRLARCCAELEKLADSTTSDERAGWILAALTCDDMRDDRRTDPREALPKVRVLLEGGLVPAACS